MIFEYIALHYNEITNREERKYGLIGAKDEQTALNELGFHYGDTLLRIEYFGSPSEDSDDYIYELNDNDADDFRCTGRKFGKIIPPKNVIPENSNIYE